MPSVAHRCWSNPKCEGERWMVLQAASQGKHFTVIIIHVHYIRHNQI